MRLDGYLDCQPDGLDSTYLRGFTLRRVADSLRALTLTAKERLVEVRLSDGVVARSWAVPGDEFHDHIGLSWDAQSGTLLVTSAADYNKVFREATVTAYTLPESGGTIQRAGRITLTGIPDKRVYGTVRRVGSEFWIIGGGYTSLMEQGGGCSMGPAVYAIPAVLPVGEIRLSPRVVLETPVGFRAERLSSPVNYFDNGDPRQNPNTPPTQPPVSTALWLSPNPAGYGWFTWGDSYYGTGVVLPDGRLVMLASLCDGRGWYQSSTLHFDGRRFEAHTFPTSGITGPRMRAAMTPLVLPRGYAQPWEGNVTATNLAGADYDPVSERVYVLGPALGADVHTARVYRLDPSGTTPTPGPPPPPPPPPVEPPVPPPAPTPQKSDATLVVQHEAVLNATRGPDGTAAGWTMTATVNGAARGAADTRSPYVRSVLVSTGETVGVRWKKNGRTPVDEILGVVE